jgi:hypothetical protein
MRLETRRKIFQSQVSGLKSGAVKRKMKTTTETQSIQRIAELKEGGEYKIFFLLVFSVFSVPLW